MAKFFVGFLLKFRQQTADYLNSRRRQELMPTYKRLWIQTALALSEIATGIVVAFAAIGQPAKAYADPGSGALLWQLFFASIVSIGFHFRKLRTWIAKRWPRRE